MSLVTLMGVAKLSELTKPAPVVKKRLSATIGLPGVKEDWRVPKDKTGN
jgi:hypothetical protein